MVDVGDDAEVPNLRRRGEGLVGEAADGNLLVKPGLGATRVSRDERCSTIAGRAGQKQTPGAISPGVRWRTRRRPDDFQARRQRRDQELYDQALAWYA